jgi:hypothetical protein
MLLQRMLLWCDVMCVALHICVYWVARTLSKIFTDVDVVDAVCRSAHH